ncbi:MAG: acyl-CoA dehydrogenase family protein, partial [Planctomycetes bacterium]|nr:acyl-CoA dehydrogenase family protein [Planctomycetota bacterium]
SDLASLQCRAVRGGDTYVINGQKIWTTLAHSAQWIYMMVRTDPEARKYRGITCLLVPMTTPGIATALSFESSAKNSIVAWRTHVTAPPRSNARKKSNSDEVDRTTHKPSAAPTCVATASVETGWTARISAPTNAHRRAFLSPSRIASSSVKRSTTPTRCSNTLPRLTGADSCARNASSVVIARKDASHRSGRGRYRPPLVSTSAASLASTFHQSVVNIAPS